MGGVDVPVLLGLLAVAALAGFVDAVAGGGGLLQLPPLLALFPPAVAMPTNKVSSICGTSAALLRYARNDCVRWRVVAVLGPVACLSSAAGSLSFLEVVKEHAASVKPVFAVCFLALSAHQVWKALGKAPARETKPPRAVLAIVFTIAIGLYDGFLGPGAGMFLFWTLTTWLALAPLQATGTTKALNWLTNLGSLAVFVAQGGILWGLALSMAAANVIGGTIGAHTAIRRGVRFIRLTTAVVCIGASVYLLVR
jgi:uncharacterized protein